MSLFHQSHQCHVDLYDLEGVRNVACDKLVNAENEFRRGVYVGLLAMCNTMMQHDYVPNQVDFYVMFEKQIENVENYEFNEQEQTNEEM